VADKKTKTIGLELEVWRQLKQISLDREATLSETVDFLILKLKEQGEDERNANTRKSGKSVD